MTLQQKIILDRLIAKPLACVLNLIVRPLGIVSSIDHSDDAQKVKSIAIAKLLGIGSILKAVPLIKTLKQKYRSSTYLFITAYRNKPLVESMSLFDKCLYINDSSLIKLFSSFLQLLWRLWRQKIDLYFDLEIYSAFSTILALLSLARNRYGFYRESTRFRLGLHTHLIYFNDHQHIVRIYLQFARVCGIKKAEMANYLPGKLLISERDKDELAKWLKSRNIAEETPYIAINPNASDLLLERRWPLIYFQAMIDALILVWHNPIFLIGSPEEGAYNNTLCGRLTQQARKYVFNTAGKISFMAAVALVSKAGLIVTNDSGFYHIAGIYNIPTISLWGPGSPAHYSDIHRIQDFVFYAKDIYCSPCIYRTEYPPCRGNNICMKSIAPIEVFKKACEILKIEPEADFASLERVYQMENSGELDIAICCVERKDA